MPRITLPLSRTLRASSRSVFIDDSVDAINPRIASTSAAAGAGSPCSDGLSIRSPSFWMFAWLTFFDGSNCGSVKNTVLPITRALDWARMSVSRAWTSRGQGQRPMLAML